MTRVTLSRLSYCNNTNTLNSFISMGFHFLCKRWAIYRLDEFFFRVVFIHIKVYNISRLTTSAPLCGQGDVFKDTLKGFLPSGL